MNSDLHGLVLHITDGGGGLTDLFSHFNSASAQFPDKPKLQVSSHFGISKEGDLWQFVDTDDMAFAIDGGPVDAQWISVENIAKFPENLTGAQVQSVAVLLAWLNDIADVPFQIANSRPGRGLGFHRMFHIGDHICPGPAVVGQRRQILQTAFTMRSSIDAAPPFLPGRWEVHVGDWTWVYVFQLDNTVDYRDLVSPNSVKGAGTWTVGRAMFRDMDVVRVKWPSGSTEEWFLPLRLQDQHGFNMDDSAPISAKKIG
jgi:hypothetical protein